MLSFASVIASLQTGHWFATPFAMLFTIGYGYVATLVGAEQLARRRAARLASGRMMGDSGTMTGAKARELESIPPAAPAEASEELAA
jgi:hypothetical protein